MAYAETNVENNMEVTCCSKDKEKTFLDRVLLQKTTSQLTNHKWLLKDYILKLVSQE